MISADHNESNKHSLIASVSVMRRRQLIAATAIIYLAVLAYLILRWDAIPDPVPMHIGVDGMVDNWAPKSFLSVTAPTWIGVAISTGIALITTPSNLARQVQTVPDESSLPFSESAARRYEAVTAGTAEFIGWVIFTAAVLIAASQIILIFPETLPFGLWLALFTAFLLANIAATVYHYRTTKRLTQTIPADEAERVRVERLHRLVSGMGTYREPSDPMAACVLPTDPSRIQLNTAHPAGKRALRRTAAGVVGSIAVPIAIALLVLIALSS